MDGLDTKRQGNFIKGGVAASPQYPNLNEDILEAFSREVVVVPVFMYTNAKSKPIIKRYLDTIKDKIGETLYELLKKNIEKEKIYFDTLNW